MPLTKERQAQLDQKGAVLVAAEAKLKEAQRILDDLGAQATEFRRQKAEHESNNDTVNAGIVGQWIATVEGKWGAQKSILDQAQISYDADKADYDAFYAGLTDEEKGALAADANANAAQAKVSEEKANNQLFIQKTTKYLIVGTIVIVIIVAVVAWARKKF